MWSLDICEFRTTNSKVNLILNQGSGEYKRRNKTLQENIIMSRERGNENRLSIDYKKNTYLKESARIINKWVGSYSNFNLHWNIENQTKNWNKGLIECLGFDPKEHKNIWSGMNGEWQHCLRMRSECTAVSPWESTSVRFNGRIYLINHFYLFSCSERRT